MLYASPSCPLDRTKRIRLPQCLSQKFRHGLRLLMPIIITTTPHFKRAPASSGAHLAIPFAPSPPRSKPSHGRAVSAWRHPPPCPLLPASRVPRLSLRFSIGHSSHCATIFLGIIAQPVKYLLLAASSRTSSCDVVHRMRRNRRSESASSPARPRHLCFKLCCGLWAMAAACTVTPACSSSNGGTPPPLPNFLGVRPSAPTCAATVPIPHRCRCSPMPSRSAAGDTSNTRCAGPPRLAHQFPR